LFKLTQVAGYINLLLLDCHAGIIIGRVDDLKKVTLLLYGDSAYYWKD